MHFLRVHFITFLTLTLLGCNSYVEKTQPGVDNESDANPISKVAFAEVKTTVLEPFCVRCHNNTRGHIKLNTYANVSNGVSKDGKKLVTANDAMSSLLVQVITNGSMPPNGMKGPDAAAMKLLTDWINGGAPEFLGTNITPPQEQPAPLPPTPNVPNSPPAKPEPPAEVVTFEKLRLAVLVTGCPECHEGEFPAADIDLSSFAGLMASNKDGTIVKAGDPENSKLYGSVSDNFMPLDRDPLADEQKQLIKQWILDGAKP